MDLGEILFKWLSGATQKIRRQPFEGRLALDLANSAYLERLELVLQALTESSVRLHLTDGLEFPDTGSLFLPPRIGLADEIDRNFLIYLYRVLTFYGAINYSPADQCHFESIEETLIRSAISAPGVHRFLSSKLSGFQELFTEAQGIAIESARHFEKKDPSFIAWSTVINRSLSRDDFKLTESEIVSLKKSWKKQWITSPFCPIHVLPLALRPNRRANESANTTLNKAAPNRSALPKPSDALKQEIHIKTVARPDIKAMDDRDENPLSHVFEKLLTAEEYQGGSKTQDGTDESDDHADALSELTLESVVRTQTQSETILKSNAQIDSFAPDLQAAHESPVEKIFTYPEWFYEKRRYLEDFCTVYESLGIAGAHDSTLILPVNRDGLREKLSSFLNESRWKPRQKDGSEFDLDAVVRWRSQLHATGPVDQRLYMGRRHLERSLGILILLDSSLSTDGWMGERRILDVIKASVATVAEAFSSLDDHFAIATFNSYSRQRCDFKWIKRFDDSWSSSRLRLQSIKPDGYTRIGPALRHAHQILGDFKARKKLILLFSDAKPSDYDRYEGEHGIHDVHKAVTEIKSHGIVMKGIAVAQENRGNLARMFGSSQYKVLSDSKQIANTVLQIFTEMIGRQ